MPHLDLDEQLKDRAILLWKQAGAPKGQEHEFWAEAAREMIAEARLKAEGHHVELRLAG